MATPACAIREAVVIRGYCPGVLRPMPAGDGLLLRIRPPAGRLSHAQIEGLAELAETFGNGTIELTRRANIQLRGLRADALAALRNRLVELALFDPSLTPEAEARLNILASPFGDLAAPGPFGPNPVEQLWHALRDRLVAAQGLALPAKFGFALDFGTAFRHLAFESADIRLETGRDATLIVRADGAKTGRPAESVAEAVALALALARWFVTSGGVDASGRGRMQAHLARGAKIPQELFGEAEPAPQQPLPEILRRVIAFDFGSATAESFRRLAAFIPGTVFVTPWRGVTGSALDTSALPAGQGAHAVFLAADDPRHRRFACVGKNGCPNACGDPRLFAREHKLLPPPGLSLHIAGCSKGCAHPGPASVVVTLTKEGFRLAKDARAGEGVPGTLNELRQMLQERA